MDDEGAGLVVLLLGDPQGLEGWEGGQDGASDPGGVLPLWWSDHVVLYVVRGEGCHFFLHAVSEARKHGGTTGQNNVGVEVLPKVNITLSDGVIEHITDAKSRKTHILGLSEKLGAEEPLFADGDHFAVRKLVGLLQRCGGGSGLHLLLKVKSDIAELLLDVTVYLPLSCEGEAVSFPLTLQVPPEAFGDGTATDVEAEDRIGKSMSIVDGDGMGEIKTSVQHCSGGASRVVLGTCSNFTADRVPSTKWLYSINLRL